MRKNVGERLPIFTPEEVKLVKGSCDFLGLNYYTSNYAENIPKKRCSRPHYDNDRHVEDHTHRNGKPISEQGGSSWLYIVPEGIYHLMLHIKERYNNPEIFITENGVDEVNNKAITVTKARIDKTRMKYHRSHLAYLKKIWHFYVDYENGRLTRFPKTSAVWWMNFLENPKNPWNRLPLKLQDVETEEERHGPAKKPRSGVA
ncbi:beta-glucosidase-like [Olea europaea var. sylvestris]|uniref:beta-glucosidase-like n=1 Tax=Olea europaea var. sylvestris TaxID=158386 RepID=UPI000C1CF58C|nr:beta-glucosidase-like [Olea europaea var. sylvestris]